MYTNITDAIIKAKGKEVLWRISEFYCFLEWIKRIELITFSFWKDEENWASLLKDDSTFGIVWTNYTLIVIGESESELISLIKDQWNYIEIVSVSHFNHAELSVNLETAIELFNTELESVFSAEDLWFATNTT